MTLYLRKKFDWEEDRENFDSSEFLHMRCGHYGRRVVIKELSWKGILRKILRIKKTIKTDQPKYRNPY